jgi:hypothetical protein
VGRITSVQPRGSGGDPPLTLSAGDELAIDVEISSTDPAEVFHLAVALDTLDGRCVLAASTKRDGEAPITGRNHYRIGFRVPSLPLAAGLFHIYAFLLDESGLYTHDQVIVTEAIRFEAPEWTSSLIDVERVWERR